MKRVILAVVVLGLFALPSAWKVSAQNGTPLDVVIQTRVVHGGDPLSTVDTLKALPVVAIADTHVSHEGQFANRHQFSLSDDGVDPKIFGTDDYFDFSFDLILSGTPPGSEFAERKEGGIIVTTAVAGEGQFIVNTDAHEVVAFGGPFPFYRFEEMEYNSGDVINMRVRYFMDMDGLRKIEYFANGVSSGPLEITNLEQAIPGPFFISGYTQIVINTMRPNNRVVAVYDGIRLNGTLVGN